MKTSNVIKISKVNINKGKLKKKANKNKLKQIEIL